MRPLWAETLFGYMEKPARLFNRNQSDKKDTI